MGTWECDGDKHILRREHLSERALRFMSSAKYPKAIDEENRHSLLTVLASIRRNVDSTPTGYLVTSC